MNSRRGAGRRDPASQIPPFLISFFPLCTLTPPKKKTKNRVIPSSVRAR